MAKSPEHGYTTKKTIKSLEAQLPAGWTWRSEQPVRVPDYDEPEPDVTIVRGTDEDYEHRIPGPDDVGLLIEISLGTLDRDRNEKLPAYARGGIPIYWLVNLVDRQVEVYTQPGPGGYRSRVDFKPGQSVRVVIDGQNLGEIAVDTILPSPPPHGNGPDVLARREVSSRSVHYAPDDFSCFLSHPDNASSSGGLSGLL